MRKINVIIIAVFFLIVGFGFAWADIDVENVLNFNLTSPQDDIILFSPPGALKPYSLGINSDGDFIIKQYDTVKFRITPSGDVYIAGGVATGTIPWSGVSTSTVDCTTDKALTGINSEGVLICEE